MHAWTTAARPKTLWAGAVPVILGTALAYGDGKAHWLAALAALAGSLLIQIGTNLSNDYSDYFKGADTDERIGPTRVTQAGLLTPGQVRAGATAAFALAVLAGLYLIWRGGWPVLVIGVVSIISGVLYTAGPKPLGYMGLGDLFVLVFFGPVAVAGTYYVQTLEVTQTAVLLGFAPGLLSVAILTVNNLRDLIQDAKAKKRTLPVRLGAAFGRWEYAATLIGGLVLALCVAAFEARWLALPTAILLIPAAGLVVRVFSEEGAALNPLLGKTAQLMLVFFVAFSLAWVTSIRLLGA